MAECTETCDANKHNELGSGGSSCLLNKFLSNQNLVLERQSNVMDKQAAVLQGQSQMLEGIYKIVQRHEEQLLSVTTSMKHHDDVLIRHEQVLEEFKEDMSRIKDKLKLTQQTQHDMYSAAFARNEDFLKVFVFLLEMGYDTGGGITCVVFRKIGTTPCVCVNLKALHNIAKMFLNSRCISSINGFPSFALFRLGSLQKLFAESGVPTCQLNKNIVNDLFEKSSTKKLKADRVNLQHWVALEMKSFVQAVKNVLASGKVQEFKDLLEGDDYPKKDGCLLVQKRLDPVKDSVYMMSLEEDPRPEGGPVFLVEYWDKLFYDNMLEYRRLLNPEQPADTHFHFYNLYSLSPMSIIRERNDVLFDAAEQEAKLQAEIEAAKEAQERAPKRRRHA